MEITRSRSFKANVDNYEAFDFFIAVKVSHQDMGYTDEEWRNLRATQTLQQQEKEEAAIRELAEDLLEKQLADEMRLVNDLREGTRAKEKSVMGAYTSQ